MKKFFTLAMAVLFAGSMMAETEGNPAAADKDVAITGTSYSIDGTYIAGLGSGTITPMADRGIKFRVNKTAGEIANAIEFKVNDGYTISALNLCGYANDNSKVATIEAVYVDGVALASLPEVHELPNKKVETVASIDLTGFNATQSVVIAFSATNLASQANINYTVTYAEAAPSTDPVLKVSTDSIALHATAANPNPSTTVKFTGKNLTAGTYNLVLPSGMLYWTITPQSVTVGEDGKLDAEITIAYQGNDILEDDKSSISLTINGITKSVIIYATSELEKKYMTSSLNIEQLVLDNGKNYDIKSALTAANIEYNNIDALDSLNDDKDFRNYPYLGLKLKKTDATLAGWLKAGSTINVRFGNVGADFLVKANGQSQTLTNAYANTSVDSTNVLTVKAPMDLYVEIVCNSTKTLVIKQIMIDEPIAPVVLPAQPTVGIENNEVGTKAVKVMRDGMLFIEKNGVLYNAQGAIVK